MISLVFFSPATSFQTKRHTFSALKLINRLAQNRYRTTHDCLHVGNMISAFTSVHGSWISFILWLIFFFAHLSNHSAAHSTSPETNFEKYAKCAICWVREQSHRQIATLFFLLFLVIVKRKPLSLLSSTFLRIGFSCIYLEIVQFASEMLLLFLMSLSFNRSLIHRKWFGNNNNKRAMTRPNSRQSQA